MPVSCGPRRCIVSQSGAIAERMARRRRSRVPDAGFPGRSTASSNTPSACRQRAWSIWIRKSLRACRPPWPNPPGQRAGVSRADRRRRRGAYRLRASTSCLCPLSRTEEHHNGLLNWRALSWRSFNASLEPSAQWRAVRRNCRRPLRALQQRMLKTPGGDREMKSRFWPWFSSMTNKAVLAAVELALEAGLRRPRRIS